MKRRILSIILCAFMLLPMMALLPVTAFAAETLPENTVVVSLTLAKAAGESEDVKIGDTTYSTVVGTTSFKTITDALAKIPAGGTILLAEGKYTEQPKIDKDVTIKGPKAGINPNVVTSGTEDWVRDSRRGTGEAIIASNWHMGVYASSSTVYDCHNITLDGVAITAGGMLRSNVGNEGYITLNYKNILVYDYTKNSGNGPFYCYSYYPNRSTNLYKRVVNAENIRFENMVGTPAFNLTVEELNAKGIFFDKNSTGKLFMIVTASDSTKTTDPVTVNVTDSMFCQKINQVINANVTTGAGGHKFNQNLANREKVTVNISRNIFKNNDSGAASNNNIVVPQIDTNNVYFKISENTFIMENAASANFIAIHGATSALALGEKFEITKNRFINIPTALQMPNSTTEFDLSGSYFAIDGVPSKPVVVGKEKSEWWYLDEAMTVRSDTNGQAVDGVLKNGTVDKTAKTFNATVNTDTFKFEIDTNMFNLVSVYSDRDMKNQLQNPVKLYKAESTFYVKVSSNDGKAFEVYTATVKTSNPDKLNYDLQSEVRYFGRTYNDKGTYFFNWSSSGFTFSFKGSGAKATIVSSAPGGSNTAYIKIYVDGVFVKDVALTKTSEEITLAENLDATKEHTIKIVKRTNARSSSAGVNSITLLDGEKLAPDSAKTRLIEFIGDSLTVGYTTMTDTPSAWSTATEDSTKTYAEQIANYFDADYMVTAISGRGVVRNTGGDTDKLLPAIYPMLDEYNNPGVAYDFAVQPDVIIINLGTNDASGNNTDLTSEAFRTGLKAFLKDVRKYNPNAEILYTYGLTTTKFASDMKAVVNELRTEGDTHINYMDLATCSSAEKAIGHPIASAYVSRGEAIIEKLKEITGWNNSTDVTTESPTTDAPTTDAPTTGTTTTDTPTTNAETTEAPAPTGDSTGIIFLIALIVSAAVAAVAFIKRRKHLA